MSGTMADGDAPTRDAHTGRRRRRRTTTGRSRPGPSSVRSPRSLRSLDSAPASAPLGPARLDSTRLDSPNGEPARRRLATTRAAAASPHCTRRAYAPRHGAALPHHATPLEGGAARVALIAAAPRTLATSGRFLQTGLSREGPPPSDLPFRVEQGRDSLNNPCSFWDINICYWPYWSWDRDQVPLATNAPKQFSSLFFQ